MLFIGLTIVAIVFVISIACNDMGREKNHSNKLPDFNSPTYNPFRDGGFNIGLSPRKGYTRFELTGMFYYLTKNNYGRFNGYAMAEIDNHVDKFAIAIYADGDHKLGYIGENTSKLHSYLIQEGGKVHAYGYIQIGFDGFFYGVVCVETNKDEVTRRGMPYNVSESDKIRFDGSKYTPKQHNFTLYESKTFISNWVFPQEWKGKKFSMIGSISPYTQKDISNWVKSNGGAFVSSVSSKVDYIIDFDPSTDNEWGNIKNRKLAIKYNTPCLKPITFFRLIQSEYNMTQHKSYY